MSPDVSLQLAGCVAIADPLDANAMDAQTWRPPHGYRKHTAHLSAANCRCLALNHSSGRKTNHNPGRKGQPSAPPCGTPHCQ
eukprot:11827848-Alexandrium_andersonii.AAC.1